MMTKKVKKDSKEPKPAIQINRSRGGGKKKPDLFERFRNTEHPLDNIIPAPEDLGTQISETGNPNKLNLETQITTDNHPTNTNLGTQQENIGNPTSQNLETQSEIVGRPKQKKLGTMAPKSESWAPKTKDDLGAIVPKENKLGSQKSKSTESYRKYEKARSTISTHIRADASIVKRAQHFIVEHKKDIPTMREFFELAANLLMEQFGDPKNLDLGTNPPYDDRRLMMLYKSKPFIINLYLRYNSIFNELADGAGKNWSPRWSPRDDEAAVRYNEISPVIIELGILQTQIQKGIGTSRIQTFKYYMDEIEKVLASGVADETLETILNYHRQIWKNQTGKEVDLNFFNDK